MDGNCNIITEILLVISTLLVTAKSNIFTVTKLLPNTAHQVANSSCLSPDLGQTRWQTDLFSWTTKHEDYWAL